MCVVLCCYISELNMENWDLCSLEDCEYGDLFLTQESSQKMEL